ncbi:MAG: hypothetical protein RBS16_01905 [Candidatus Cloacimonadales bacterium]|jgi:hypothetical protein|nr:hypothetical protein [Candidatus Cloacimonadota bacterium]MDD3501773.1 hypothetical protein [Candidatus Cloacimonadota bacterium]MDX9976767.1 hypothetical protein [Candidatus Cloacimonadales bacterium]
MTLLKKNSADRFIKLMTKSSPFLKQITFATLNEPVGSYPLLTLSRYKTRGINRNAIATLQNVSDTTINFNAKELVLPLVIPDSYIEDMNSSHEKVASYVASVFAMDLQYLFLNGDTDEKGTTDIANLRKAMDGIVKQLTAKAVDYKEDASKLEIIKTLVKALPENALADPDLKIYVGATAYTELWDEIANNSADKALLLNNGKIVYRGKEVIEIPELSKIVIINPNHIVGGICRDITMETQRYPEARGQKVVVSARVDFQVVTDYAVMEGEESEEVDDGDGD